MRCHFSSHKLSVRRCLFLQNQKLLKTTMRYLPYTFSKLNKIEKKGREDARAEANRRKRLHLRREQAALPSRSKTELNSRACRGLHKQGREEKRQDKRCEGAVALKGGRKTERKTWQIKRYRSERGISDGQKSTGELLIVSLSAVPSVSLSWYSREDPLRIPVSQRKFVSMRAALIGRISVAEMPITDNSISNFHLGERNAKDHDLNIKMKVKFVSKNYSSQKICFNRTGVWQKVRNFLRIFNMLHLY